MATPVYPFVFGRAERMRLAKAADLDLSVPATDLADLPPTDRSEIELLITGWGAPPLGSDQLDALPSLRGVVHWGGSVGFLDSAATERGIAVSTGRSVNAIPVAEYTLAMMVLASKDVLWTSRMYCREQRPVDREAELPDTGFSAISVGIVGASTIGTLVMEMLKPHDVDVLLHHPRASHDRAAQLGTTLVDDLHELARRSRILSIHAPDMPRTRGMISRTVMAALPDRATIINTSRGALIDQEALVDELESGRLRAILDVTEPDVLPQGHPLYTLPNVFLTPHLAGSMGNELRRLGSSAVAEVERFAAGLPFAHPIVP